MYLSVCTRPDIAHAASYLSQFNNCHGSDHWTAAKRVLRYLKGTRDVGLVYGKTSDPLTGYQDKELEQLLDEKTGDRYRLQLMRLSRALKEKRSLYAQRHDKVILLHDNARPHVAKPVKTYLETLKWEVLPHPLYSPDIAPSDFHLFRSMAHGLADRRFHSYEEAQKWIDS
ncbi:MOS1T transposase, partial [Pseudoatta argentina]